MEAKQGLTSEGTHVHKREIRTRQRASMSCSECRRRKQKCNQSKDKPCNNCARRFPPVPCTYESFRKPSMYQESIIDLNVVETKVEESESDESVLLSPTFEVESPLDNVFQTDFLDLQISREWRSPSDLTVPMCYPEVPLVVLSSDGEGILNGCTSSRDSAERSLLDEADYLCSEAQKNPDPKFDGIDGSCVVLQPLEILPVPHTARNAYLLRFFAQTLSPYMSSIDGCHPPISFTSQWLPFMTQSPVAAHVTILSGAYFEAMRSDVNVEKSVDAISSKGTLITLINKQIGGDRKKVSNEVIAAVMSLASNESIYFDQRSTMAHMRGLRDMIRTRGGMDNIRFDLLRKMLLRTDYQIASTYECEPILDIESKERTKLVRKSFPLELDNPILPSPIPFVETLPVLNISSDTARILDLTRSLTVSILSLTDNNPPQLPEDELLTRIHALGQRITSSPPTNSTSLDDFIYQTCRWAAIIYSSAITQNIPLSVACTPELFQNLWAVIWRVPLHRWKQIPGVFLWILLVAGPMARDKPEGKMIKALTLASIMAMGLVDWDTVMVTLKGFVAVQRWLAGDSRRLILPVRSSTRLGKSEHGYRA